MANIWLMCNSCKRFYETDEKFQNHIEKYHAGSGSMTINQSSGKKEQEVNKLMTWIPESDQKMVEEQGAGDPLGLDLEWLEKADMGGISSSDISHSQDEKTNDKSEDYKSLNESTSSPKYSLRTKPKVNYCQDEIDEPTYAKVGYKRRKSVNQNINKSQEVSSSSDGLPLIVLPNIEEPTTSPSTSKPAKPKKPKKYECPEPNCDKKFSNTEHVEFHMRIHYNIRPYQCSMCPKEFIQLSQVQAHERIHTNDKPYLCKWCGSTFRQLSNLQVHERIHTGERPYGCPLCEEKFRDLASLRLHKKKHSNLETQTS